MSEDEVSEVVQVSRCESSKLGCGHLNLIHLLQIKVHTNAPGYVYKTHSHTNASRSSQTLDVFASCVPNEASN